MFQGRAAENEINLHLDLPGGFLDLEGDRDQIKQLILNLLSNAIKYNHSGGKVFLRGWEDTEKVFLEVKDTGPGIPPESIPRLFEKFYRVPDLIPVRSGTGLGLSICKRIVENHGGSIAVVSSVGVGTSFIVQLPAKRR
jgi:two-component system phosphate regulon sensor histidine kinase PhoR